MRVTAAHDLPVRTILPQLYAALESPGTAVLCAPTGSGKTTLVPLALTDQVWLGGRKIVMLEPRRLAARGAASYMAFLLGESVGATVGYRIRLEKRVSGSTRIEVVTEGILTRWLQKDPMLEGVGLVIFDEIHERNLHSDLALALCLDARQGLRNDLRLLAMSATMDSEAVADLLGGAPVIRSGGRSYPIDVSYLEQAENSGDIVTSCAHGINRALAETRGDLLAFLPGGAEIRKLAARLQAPDPPPGILILPLYGDLSPEAQQQAIQPDPAGRRRVVLATSIAETSLTIEGITTVVDAGATRVPRFDPNTGLGRLETVRVSRAAADQRAGRAGRLGPGRCYRLWTRTAQDRLRPQEDPEILHTDLAPLALELAQWGVSDPQRLAWLDAPPAGAYAQARELLLELDAVDSRGRITAVGARLAQLPLHPRLSQMVFRALESGQQAEACDLAALLSERDILRAAGTGARPCDLEQRLHLLRGWRSAGNAALAGSGATASSCRRVDRISRQWQHMLRRSASGAGTPLSVGGLLALAYPDRVAKRRSPAACDYQLTSGRAVYLPDADSLNTAEFLVAPAIDAGRGHGRVFLAAALPEAELRAILRGHLQVEEVVTWDRTREAVAARREERLGSLLLSSQALARPAPERLAAAMLEGVRGMGITCLPWSPGARDWQARVLSLRAWQPQADWPDVSDQALLTDLEAWLAPYLSGMKRLADLQKLDLAKILQNLLGWPQRQRLAELAPGHLVVPSGTRKRLDYMPGEAPVLAVRLQEMFGLADTPRVCGGQVPVMLHLLSPAQRPIQVTQDLSGFWNRTYAEVRKELKGRYPKHYWPEDPWGAQACARVRPRPR